MNERTKTRLIHGPIYRAILYALFIFVGTCAVLVPSSANSSEITIELNSVSQVNGSHIELNEISTIVAPEDIYEILISLRVGITPPLSNPITYRKSDLVARLALEGYAETDYLIIGPDTIRIERAGIDIKSSQLEAALEEELTLSFDGVVKSRWNNRFPDIRIPDGDLEISIKYPSYKFGALPQVLIVKVDNRLIRQFPLSSYVVFNVPVVIAKTGIPRGAIVTVDMVEIDERSISPGSSLITLLDNCIGLEAKRSIGSGEILAYESLMKPFDVERGDSLAITVMKGNLTFEVTASASESGYIGEQILVKIDDTGKTLRITLTTENTGVAVLPA